MTPETGSGSNDCIAIAIIRKPIGLAGWCGVTALGNSLAQLDAPLTVLAGRSAETARSIVIEEIVLEPKGFRLLFEGYADRDSVEALRDLTLFLPRDRLPSLDEGEFFHFEMEGMAVVDAESGQEVGVVEVVHNYPSVDAVEVRTVAGHLAMIPLTRDAVEKIDRAGRRILIRGSQCEDLL
jgi:16S rRNA processing protein RimM